MSDSWLDVIAIISVVACMLIILDWLVRIF